MGVLVLQESWAGVQCKGKDLYTNQTVTEKELLKEVEKAKTFEPALSSWILATTGKKDAAIEEKARKLTTKHLQQGLFSVDIWFWVDILDELDSYQAVGRKYYPNFFDKAADEPAIKNILSALLDARNHDRTVMVIQKIEQIERNIGVPHRDYKCKVVDVNCDELHARFHPIKGAAQDISHPINKITVTEDTRNNMKMFTLAL